MHVKVRAPGQQTLTTELYFPGAPYNDRDPYFDKRLLVHLAEYTRHSSQASTSCC
jgi:protocatechuate 3,4-dioxygenase beta subunit